MVSDGSMFKVIRDGRYRGNLVMLKHKYFLCGGSWDWLYVVTPNGVEVGPIGTDADDLDSALSRCRDVP